MTDHIASGDRFHPRCSIREVNSVSALGLAHLGDAVYEILVRSMLVMEGRTPEPICIRTPRRWSARRPALAADKLFPLLTEEEQGFFRRGRNAGVKHIPKNATHTQYSKATALEALFGALYLLGRQDRLCQLFDYIMEDSNAT